MILSSFVVAGTSGGLFGGGFIGSLMVVLLVGLAALAIWAAGTWFIGKFGAPAIVRNIWDGLFLLVGLFILVNFLMTLAGRPLIVW